MTNALSYYNIKGKPPAKTILMVEIPLKVYYFYNLCFNPDRFGVYYTNQKAAHATHQAFANCSNGIRRD